MESKKYKILLVDDEEGWCQRPIAKLEENGFEVVYEGMAENALKLIKSSSPDVVLLDVLFGNENKGKPAFDQIKKKYPDLPVIILTSTMKDTFNIKDYPGCAFAYAKDQLNTGAEEAYKEFGASIRRIIEASYNNADTARKMFDFVIGNTPAMKKVCNDILSVAHTNTTVLITGESGTGKELVANALHEKSPRGKRPFKAVNCASFSDQNLLKSELFGHEKGAFTGAIEQHKGIFETAQEGTVFLDEIGDASPEVQASLLRVLQEKVMQRLGGMRDVSVDIRIIAATNRGLEEEMRLGRFREDLYYRLNQFSIHMPSLRERKEDIPELLAYFIRKFNKELGKNILIETVDGKRDYLRPDVLTLLKSHSWPGNIRQFENEVRTAIIKAGEYNVLLPEHFDLEPQKENNLFLDIDHIVNEVFAGKWKGKEAWSRFTKIYTKMKIDDREQGHLGQIMKRCIQRRKNELKRDLKHEDMAELFGIEPGTMRKWITVELKIDWKQEKKYGNK